MGFPEPFEKTACGEYDRYYLAEDEIGCRIVGLRLGYIVVDGLDIVNRVGFGFLEQKMENLE